MDALEPDGPDFNRFAATLEAEAKWQDEHGDRDPIPKKLKRLAKKIRKIGKDYYVMRTNKAKEREREYRAREAQGPRRAIYEMLKGFHMEAHIPFDNRVMVEKGGRDDREPLHRSRG